MKIALISSSYPPTISGVSSIVEETARRLSESEEVLVITSKHPESLSSPKEKNLTVLRLPSFQNPLRTTHFIPIPSPMKVKNALKSFSPEIIHFHDMTPLTLHAYEYAKKTSTPIITTHHFTPNLVLDQLKGIPFSSKISGSGITQDAIIKTAAILYDRIDGATVPSLSALEALKKETKTPLFHLPNSIDTSLFKRDKNASKKYDVVYVGRLDKEKNISILIESLGAVESQNKTSSLIVGSGVEEKLMTKLASPYNIEFRGKVQRDKLPEIYNQAKVFATCSTIENFPITVLEAMACGLPIVAPKIGGIPELVKHEKNGLLTTPESAASTAAALQKILDNPEKSEKMGEESEKLAKNYETDAIIKQLINLYQDLT